MPAVHLDLRGLEQADPDRPAALLHHRHPQLVHRQEDHPVEPIQIQDHLQVRFRVFVTFQKYFFVGLVKIANMSSKNFGT
jgi:hypothetical protein